jgi:two-component system, NarL family, nitrate/nitrite response regulator NarL
MNDSVRLLLIDDHTIFRESLLRLLSTETGLQVVGHCSTISEARKILSETLVNVVLLDYDLGEEAGTSLLRYLSDTSSSARALMLTAGMMASATLDALNAGAAGMVLKHSGTHHLLEAIDRVSKGGAWWDTGILRFALSRAREDGDHEVKARDVTERQRRVLRCILDGLTNKEIAVHLDSSETAIKASIQELFNKAGVRTRSQLVRVAIERFSSDWLQDAN